MAEEKRIITPLSSTFMLTSIIGFLVSAFYIPTMFDPIKEYGLYEGSISFAFAFGLIFVLMFVASLISMSASLEDIDHLHIDEKRRVKI